MICDGGLNQRYQLFGSCFSRVPNGGMIYSSGLAPRHRWQAEIKVEDGMRAGKVLAGKAARNGMLVG